MLEAVNPSLFRKTSSRRPDHDPTRHARRAAHDRRAPIGLEPKNRSRFRAFHVERRYAAVTRGTRAAIRDVIGASGPIAALS